MNKMRKEVMHMFGGSVVSRFANCRYCGSMVHPLALNDGGLCPSCSTNEKAKEYVRWAKKKV
jgi:predicted Zn-ribbon and HTH transcriptional regulator